jgi:Na+-transporting methylmalonyl-CoA/oxaloacetate decarboxylase gamma subunit
MPTLDTSLIALADLPRPAPLFGNQWLALLAVLGSVAILIFLIAMIGRWLAATHPEPSTVKSPAQAQPSETATIDPQVFAVISAAVAATQGDNIRVADVKLLAPKPSVEVLMTQWAIEGRRQIYTSHKIR